MARILAPDAPVGNAGRSGAIEWRPGGRAMKAHEIRRRIGHPVIDADGHVLEYLPAVEPFLREVLGPRLFERWQSHRKPLERILEADPARRLATRAPQSAWWGTPARNVR